MCIRDSLGVEQADGLDVAAHPVLAQRQHLCRRVGDLEQGLGRLVDADICLLYTSPSPRDRTRSRMPSSA